MNRENPNITGLWRKAPETLPKFVNHPDYDGTIPCLVFRKGMYEILYYDLYNECWNDSENDDYAYGNDEELKYIQLEED